MSDKVVEVRATEIPGMRIKFSAPISPDGAGMEFEVGVDATIDRPELDLLLDTVASARRRQAAIEELPLERQGLYRNSELLKIARREKAAHEARMGARLTALGARRRGEVMPNPQDVNALSQHDNRIMQIEEQIERAKARIPYLEALIDNREPPDYLPAANDGRMAAE
jgi:hypothetical protein